MNPNKAPGSDSLPPILKELPDVITEPLTILLNMSLKEGRLPSTWKVAHVVPILKKGKRVIQGTTAQ